MKFQISRVIVGALLFASLLMPAGCAGRGPLPLASGTRVELARKNYRLIRPNVTGRSSGFYFLGVIPIIPPRYTDAMSDLYSKAGLSKGKAQALVNVVQEKSTIYLILFSIPRLTIRADVVEFIE